MKNAIFLGVLLAVAVALVPQATARGTAHQTAKAAKTAHAVKVVPTPDPVEMRRVLAGIHTKRNETWRWQRVMHRARTQYSTAVTVTKSLKYRQWVLKLWQKRADAAKRQALNPPHKAEWLCIHHYEGSWTDPNSPYFGGLQMDVGFQATYGGDLLRRKGTADHWTPLEQMWVAERAYTTRGFWPWPNTARYCGLLG